MQFFQSFVDLNKQEFDYLDFIHKHADLDLDNLSVADKQQLMVQHPNFQQYFIRPYMNNANFRNYYISTVTIDFELIKELSAYLRSKMLKPQELCYDNPNWYVAIDNITSTAYICYKQLAMLDIDFYKLETTHSKPDATNKVDEQVIINNFTQYTNQHPDMRFWLYKSQGGIHAFLVSEYADYRQQKYIDLMLDFKCDLFYIVFSYLRGWSVRLNRKLHESDTNNIYQFITAIGSGTEIDDLCQQVSLHINLLDAFKDMPASQMYGGKV